MASEVRCDHCGCAFEPNAMTETDGEIEYTFFRCDFCGKAFMISVTDEALRKDIAVYVEMARRNAKERLPEAEQRVMQALKESNVARAGGLRKQYLREE